MKEYRDYYFLKAKRENYPARSVYKLRELDARYKLLRRGAKVLDLGAAPGSWTLGAAEKVGANGLVIGCDLLPLTADLPLRALFFRSDILSPSEEFERALAENAPFDLVMSDMAPATTGSKITDQARSLELAQSAFRVALMRLRPDGNFVTKIFMGPDVNELLNPMRLAFKSVKTFKPKSSRAESKETFYVGLGLKAYLPDNFPEFQI